MWIHSRSPRVRRAAAPVLGLGALAASALVLAGCSSSDSGGGATGTSPNAAGGNGAAGTTIDVRSGPLGPHLTDANGRSLYLFVADSATRSACSGVCATYWPPLGAKSTAGSGVTAADVTSIRGANGHQQAVYHGHPLYFFGGDSAPGQTNGQGSSNFGAKWWLVAPSGAPIMKAPSSVPGTNSGGYGG